VPVLGVLEVWGDGKFRQFDTGEVEGLARVDGTQVDVLAMDAHRPGHGAGGRFLSALMAEYETVRVLVVGNSLLVGMLLRRNFTPFTEGEGWQRTDGYVWRRSAVGVVETPRD
jgi:hypothetical protein